MSAMYECDLECGWTNDAWRYGMAEAGATWASHMADHKRENEKPARALAGYFVAPDGYDEDHVWRENGERPIPALSRRALRDDHLWAAIVELIEGAS